MGKAETLLQIKEAEEKSKRMIEEAKEKQRSIIAAARREALDRIQKAEDNSKAASQSAISEEERRIASEREALLLKGNEEATALASKANQRIPTAKTYLKTQFERMIDAATGSNE